MPSKRINMRQPADWVDAWEQAAKDTGITLSEWVGNACNEALAKRVRAKLSERQSAGRPKTIGSD